jgi:hypothetical protein
MLWLRKQAMTNPIEAETKAKRQMGEAPDMTSPPKWLLAFCYLLMGPGVAINCTFIAFSTPGLADLGLTGLVIAFAIGMVLGIPAAALLARKIHQGISK